MATYFGTEGNDSISGGGEPDNIDGFGGNDFLAGNGDSDFIRGGAGNDTIYGDSGNDQVEGGAGNDLVSGGGGQDTILFREFGAANADTVASYDANWDRIQLDQAAFSTIGATGRFAAGDVRFYAATGATSGHDADDRIVYNTSTGQLFYDADGNGSGAAQLIATFQGAPNITATDINSFGTATPTPTPPGTINGTSGDDTLIGTSGPDTINGLGGNDSIRGGAGADSMNGGDSNDTLDGLNRPTDGPSLGYNDVDVDTMEGGLGDDTYYVDNPDDVLSDLGGTDTVVSQNVHWTLGPSFENLIVRVDDEFGGGTGNDSNNIIDVTQAYKASAFGMGGNDLLLGGGKNHLFGGDGNDTLTASSNLNSLDGGNGDDVLSGGFDNTWTGGAGADNFLFDVAGADQFVTDFASGTDRITLDARAMPALGASGQFSASDPRFYAGPAAHDADDRVILNGGTLLYDPDGTGSQAASVIAAFSSSSGSTLAPTDIWVVNGTTPSPTPSPTPTPTPIPAGSMVGTSGNDNMQGTSGNDSIFGLGGNDTIFANGGNDWVQGGAGNDAVSGGGGQDIYAFAESGAANADTVANFDTNWDAIRLDAAGFSNIGAAGRFAGGDVRFFAAAGATSAHDADDRLVYNTSTGQLFYDGDGSGGTAAALIATFNGAPGVAATDITVFGTATPSPTPSPTPTPTPGAINGTEGNDSLVGSNGNDVINGFGGNDTLDGGAGSDTMDGGNGDDVYIVDRLGNDVVIEAQNGGIDEVRAFHSYTLPDWVNNLTLLGMEAFTGIGNDIDNVIDGRQIEGANLWGMGGNDLLMAGDFSGIHQMHGGVGNDTIQGGSHTSWMFGDDGNDVLRSENSNDSLTGGAGSDSFVFMSPSGIKTVADFVSGVDEMRFDGRSFTQIGASGDFVPGDGRFFAAAGASGGHDTDDRIVYDTSNGNLYYDADGSGAGGAQLFATLQGAPALSATDLAVDNGSTPTPSPTPTPTPGSRMSGTNGNDTIVGTAGNDTIFGNSGNDWIEGRGGNDQLSGGSGQDSYVFREFGAGNADTLLNFDTNWDSLRLDNAAFTGLGGDGRFAAGDARFFAGAGATAGHDADDRIVYDTSTGQLYYDADGAGGADAQLVATVQGTPTVAAGDIWVV
jgi:Ca2+-binding RTX toxin-like protein